MPITRRVMAQGDWSVRLRDDTPQSILDSISTPFAEIVVTSGRIPAQQASISDTLALTAARYVGVVLRPGPQLELGGAGHEWWLGDDQGWQPLEAAVVKSAGTLTQWVTDIIASPLTVGSVTGAGTLDGRYHWVSRRQALDSVCRSFGVEWRINNNRSVDTGTQTNLYGTTPTALIVRRDGGREVTSPFGVNGIVSARWNFEAWTARVVVLGGRGRSAAGSAVSYLDPTGTTVVRTRVVEAKDAPYGTETVIATTLRDQLNAAVREVSVDVLDYDVLGKVTPGANVWLYDPWLGLDAPSTTQIDYNGRKIHPVTARVVGVTMPIERGMGVYYRLHNGVSPSYIDLTDWVEWEGPGGRLELGSASIPLVDLATPTGTATAFGAWDTYTPTVGGLTLGNGTASAWYRREGTTLHVSWVVTLGSTSSDPGGTTDAWTVSLPAGMTAATGRTQFGVGQHINSTGTQFYRLVWQLASGGTTFAALYQDASANNLNDSRPNAVAAGIQFGGSATVEVAP